MSVAFWLIVAFYAVLSTATLAYLYRVGKYNLAKPHWLLPVPAPKTLAAEYTFRRSDLGVL